MPDDGTIGRFRQRIVEYDLWGVVFSEINRQLEVQNIIMVSGRINIADATPIEANQSRKGTGKDDTNTQDADAGWHVKKDSQGHMRSTYGYSIHVGCDEDGFIHRQTVTAGNVHDSTQRDALLLGNEKAFYADSAYYSKETSDKLARLGIDNKVQRKGYRPPPLSQSDKDRNAQIAVIRAGVERTFAVYKMHYNLSRTRFVGLAKNIVFYGIITIAYNIQKGVRFLDKYGVPNPKTN